MKQTKIEGVVNADGSQGIKDYDRGWIEALIDGEGYLSIFRRPRPLFKAKYSYSPRMGITNNDIKLLRKARKIIGGGRIGHHSKRPTLCLEVGPNLLRIFLPKIRLITKELNRKFLIRTLVITKRLTVHNQPRTDMEIRKLEIFYLKVKALNKPRRNHEAH